MKNKHLEHIEDHVLTGKQGALDAIRFLDTKQSQVSVKYDGAPAIVYGTNPENGKFFVGTKSVFNKRRIKINYTHTDIESNHGHIPKVASILHICLDRLPHNDGIYQGDFIGYGGSDTHTPNTITYKFDDVIDDIVVATHTQYIGATIQELDAEFHYRESKSYGVHFIDTSASISKRHFRLNLLITLAKTVIPFVKFPESDDISQLKININSYIRSGQTLDADKLASDTGYSRNLFHLYNMIIEIKELLMEGITTTENVQCLFENMPYEHEGYVMSNQYGTFKLVKRQQFSYANFNARQEWKKEVSRK